MRSAAHGRRAARDSGRADRAGRPSIRGAGHRSTLGIAAQGKKQGATVVAIVGGPSPLVDMADISLVMRTFENTDIYTPTVSRLAGLVMVDVLATAIATRRGPEHLRRLQAMKEDLADFRGSVERRHNASEH